MVSIESPVALRRAFERGTLDIVVGAGTSISAGLPDWNTLNRRLLSQFLADHYDGLAFSENDLGRLAERFVARFGREAVIDVLKRQAGRRYRQYLQSALRAKEKPDPQSAHFELGAMIHKLPKRRLYTFNFDTLLEVAAERLLGACASIDSETADATGAAVVHLHGMIGRRATSGRLVLSERDYYDAEIEHWSAALLRELLIDSPERRRDVLLVGLSLADQRLRRFLLDRITFGGAKHGARVTALLFRKPLADDADLLDRLAFGFANEHEVKYWRSWGIEAVFVPSPELIPYFLRGVRLGTDAARWRAAGRLQLGRVASAIRYGYANWFQRWAVQMARESLRFWRSKFAVSRDEELQLGAFAPISRSEPTIQLLFKATLKGRPERDHITESYADSRQLSVASIRAAQGVAGRAFVLGATAEGTRGSELIDFGFTPRMRDEWNALRTTASVLCVPVFDSPQWLPVGVMYLTSNRSTPFWSTLPSKDFELLERSMRTLFPVIAKEPRFMT